MLSKKNIIRGLLIAGLLASVGVVAPETAKADTATDLKCSGCVGKKDIGKQAVTTKAIKKKSVKPSHLADSAKPSGLDHTSGDQSFSLSGSEQVVRSVMITAPAAGRVMVVASWTVSDTTGGTSACSVGTGTSLDSAHTVYTYVSIDVPYVPGAAVRSFDVPAGETTFNLVCLGSAANLYDSSITGLFVPGSY